MEKIELLSPAGDMEKLRIAFLYGADACYIGGKDFSLRANADNFSIEEIKEACEYAHKLNKKIYVTINIIFHDEAYEKDIEEYLKELENAKVDAVIISDLFLIDLIKENAPNVKIFLSTQTSICNSESVKLYKSLGVDRVVLAREVQSSDIKKIYEETKMDLEVFLHGAMCTCYSGRCVLSNYFTNRDSNRGGCAQVCRFNLDLDKKRDNQFSIATKDLNLTQFIPELIEIGVKSLKIEGRMRGTYYLATVNSCYRNLIDAYYNNSFTDEVLSNNLKLLSRVANRETSTQYFDKEANETDQYYSNTGETSNQDFLAQIISYDKKEKYAIIEQRNNFKVGDTVTIFGPDNVCFDLVVDALYDATTNQELDCARHAKQLLKLKVNQEVKKDYMIRVKI